MNLDSKIEQILRERMDGYKDVYKKADPEKVESIKSLLLDSIREVVGRQERVPTPVDAYEAKRGVPMIIRNQLRKQILEKAKEL